MLSNLPLFRYGVVSSTMDLAKHMADSGLLCCIMAEEQTAGRGKPGSSWISKRGNLLLSIVCYNTFNLSVGQLSVFFGLVVGRAAAYYLGDQEELKYKYPNDVYLGGRKLAGILIENSNHLIVGLGVNLVAASSTFACLQDYGVSVSSVHFFNILMKEGRKLEEELILKGWAHLEGMWRSRLLIFPK